MACRELAALRLGLMSIIGIDDPAERQHELDELGDASTAPGPLGSLVNAGTLTELAGAYAAALSDLEEQVSRMQDDDPKLPYYRTLIIQTKQFELELQNRIDSLERMYKDLDVLHHLIHEVYPAS